MPEGIPRRFILQRHDDETGLSGEGMVAWGVCFPDGVAVTRWCVTDVRQTCTWRSMDDVFFVHGHQGKTEVVWLDPEQYDGPRAGDGEAVPTGSPPPHGFDGGDA